MVKVEVGRCDFLENFLLVVALERQIPRHQCVEEHTQRPDVRLSLVAPLKNLRCHVIGCPCDVMQLCGAASLRESKNNESDRVLVSDHYVFGLDVPVDHVIRVAVIDGFEQVLHVDCRLSLAE